MSLPTVTALANNPAYNVSADQWNAVVVGVKNQPYSYLIYSAVVGGTTYYYAKNGVTGQNDWTSTTATTVIQNAYNAAPVRSNVVCVSYIPLTTTLVLNREVNLKFDTFHLSGDFDGLVVSGNDTLPKIVSGMLITCDYTYTHAVITLTGTTDATINIYRIWGGDSSGTGILLLSDGHGVNYNNINFHQIGGLGNCIKLDCKSTTDSFINCNTFNGTSGWIWASDVGINIINEGVLQVSNNIFNNFWYDGATKMTTGIHNEGTETVFNNVNEMDMVEQARLYNSAAASAILNSCLINRAYITNLGSLILPHYTASGVAGGLSNGSWINTGFASISNIIVSSFGAYILPIVIGRTSTSFQIGLYDTSTNAEYTGSTHTLFWIAANV